MKKCVYPASPNVFGCQTQLVSCLFPSQAPSQSHHHGLHADLSTIEATAKVDREVGLETLIQVAKGQVVMSSYDSYVFHIKSQRPC